MLTLDEAQRRLLALVPKIEAERVVGIDALDRVLAEDLLSPEDVPAFDASMMDGYAVRADDVITRTSLPIRGESKTGSPYSDLESRTACRIFTGAVMPRGADAVVMQEDATATDGDVFFSSAVKRGQHVRRRGEDLKRGEIGLKIGMKLNASALSLAATLERNELLVACRPRVAILATGDELRDPGQPGNVGSIPESNGIAIAAMATRAGAIVKNLPRVIDRLEIVTRAISDALLECDLLVTIGGVSVGDHDVVRPALEAAGVSLDFWRVAIKPGKPVCVGQKEKGVIVGLPGNPASAMITFALFGVPFLRALQGDSSPWPMPMRFALSHDLDRKGGRLEFARAILERDRVTLVRHQASSSIVGMANANALVAMDAETTHFNTGDKVDVYSFAELGL